MVTPSLRRSWSTASRWPLRPAAPTILYGHEAAIRKPLSQRRRRLRPRPRQRLCLLRRQVLRPRYRLLRLSQSRRHWPKRGKKSGRATAPEKPRTTRWRSPNCRRRPGQSRNATTYRVHRGRSGLRAVPSAGCAELSRVSLRQRGSVVDPVGICRRLDAPAALLREAVAFMYSVELCRCSRVRYAPRAATCVYRKSYPH